MIRLSIRWSKLWSKIDLRDQTLNYKQSINQIDYNTYGTHTRTHTYRHYIDKTTWCACNCLFVCKNIQFRWAAEANAVLIYRWLGNHDLYKKIRSVCACWLRMMFDNQLFIVYVLKICVYWWPNHVVSRWVYISCMVAIHTIKLHTCHYLHGKCWYSYTFIHIITEMQANISNWS